MHHGMLRWFRHLKNNRLSKYCIKDDAIDNKWRAVAWKTFIWMDYVKIAYEC